jgi:L-seryl-tRNA(Ser) seleniumtransferase
MKEHFAKLPSVNSLLENLAVETKRMDARYIKSILIDILQNIKTNPKVHHLDKKTREQLQKYIIQQAKIKINTLLSPALKRVVNATGIVLHTGLGRAPLGNEDMEEILNLAYYSNLEINLNSGKRGERLDHVTSHLKLLTGAEDAAVVNNNAAAVLLSLHSIAKRKEVIISRGELVEIGGSFRMPEVMQNSQAKMVEVGATNKTHLQDYISAISDKTAAIMLVHPSNFQIIGFTNKPDLTEIVDLAHRNNLPVIYDLGSGALEDMRRFTLGSEPIVRDIVEVGVDVVTFSGDKLLGGPQSGIIVGTAIYIKKIRRNHLLRALRCDKITLSLLNIALRKYMCSDDLQQKNLSLQLFSRPKKKLEQLAHAFIKKLDKTIQDTARIVTAEGKVGSGAFPTLKIPTVGVRINHPRLSANSLAKKLRHNQIPIIGIIERDHYLINFLTIFEHDINIIAKALNNL